MRRLFAASAAVGAVANALLLVVDPRTRRLDVAPFASLPERLSPGDLVVVNEVGRPGTGFGSDTNRAAILSRHGADTPLREWAKDKTRSAQ